MVSKTSQADEFAFLCLSVALFCFLASDKVNLISNGDGDTYQVWNNDHVIDISICSIYSGFSNNRSITYYYPANTRQRTQRQ